MSFAVELDIYRGPLELLLYLVRKHEIEVEQVSVSSIAEQFQAFLGDLKSIDVNLAADVLEIATTLAEMKARQLMPQPEEAPDEERVEDTRQDLVRRLLEFKWFRDAASILEERSRTWQERHGRPTDSPPGGRDLADEPIRELEIWDLVSAFTRLLRENLAVQPASIVYDETPIHVYMEQIHGKLTEHGRMSLSEMFRAGMHKSTLVSIFLAVMELVRSRGAIAEQDRLFGEIWLRPGPGAALDLSQADNYEGPPQKAK
ncbi:MAG: segregation/condensation protein A [Planctomycetia bacterium]|nr:segregation/condensation protein A [Planctomycetia bacterium]